MLNEFKRIAEDEIRTKRYTALLNVNADMRERDKLQKIRRVDVQALLLQFNSSESKYLTLEEGIEFLSERAEIIKEANDEKMAREVRAMFKKPVTKDEIRSLKPFAKQ